MALKFLNNVKSVLSADLTDTATSLIVSTGTGVDFPVLSVNDYFYCTLVSAIGTREIVKVTARTDDTFTIVRAQDGTSAHSFSAGDTVSMRMTAGAFTDILNATAAASALPTPIEGEFLGAYSTSENEWESKTAAELRTQLGSTAVGDAVFTATDATAARTALDALATDGDGSSLTGITSSQISGLGTAATVNTGTTEGTIPVLGEGGLLPESMVVSGFPNRQVFTTSGTFTVPKTCDYKVTVIGGGCSGSVSGAASPISGQIGGTAGGTGIGVVPLTAAATVPVTVGTGGARVYAQDGASALGTAGTSSSFGTYIVCTGGSTTSGGAPSFTGVSYTSLFYRGLSSSPSRVYGCDSFISAGGESADGTYGSGGSGRTISFGGAGYSWAGGNGVIIIEWY